MLLCHVVKLEEFGGMEGMLCKKLTLHLLIFFLQVLNGGDNIQIQKFVIYTRHIWMARDNML